MNNKIPNHVKGMRIINPKEFRAVRNIYLNRDGKKIGVLSEYKGNLYYKTYRRPPKGGDRGHYYIDTGNGGGFAVQQAMIERIIEEEKIFKKTTKNEKFAIMVLVFYDGEREKRWYIADPYDFKIEGKKIDHVKDMGDSMETYGSQYALPKSKMKIFGYGIDDYRVQEALDRTKMVPTQGFGSGFNKNADRTCLKCDSTNLTYPGDKKNVVCKECGYTIPKKQYQKWRKQDPDKKELNKYFKGRKK